MRKYLWAFALLFLLSTGKNYAQTNVVFSVQWDTSSVSPSTLFFGDSLFMDFNIVNVGTADYVGEILILRQRDSITTIALDTTPVVTIPVGDTLPYSGAHIVQQAQYDGGINILVIWPAGVSVPTTTLDTIYDYVNVLDTIVQGTKLPAADKKAKIYPNPALDWIRIEYPANSPEPEAVRLYDATGKPVREIENGAEQLSLNGLAKGVYLLEIRYRNGLRQHAKLVLSN